MLLDRLPAWATTGVGSLPHTDPLAAAEHAVSAYDVPFCPQLPRLEGDMVREWLGADPDRCGWSPARDRERPPAWEALLAALDRDPPPHRLVKLQVTGPATLAHALERAHERADRPRTTALARELADWLAANVAGQVRSLAERGLDSMLVVDEPALPQFSGDEIASAWAPLRSVAPAWGLHLCCAVPWDVVDHARPDLLSFDLALAPLDDGAADTLQRLLARGGRIAWGVLAAHRAAEQTPEATDRLRAALGQIRGGEEIARQSLLTASCGTGLVSLAREREVAAALRDVAQSL